MAVFYFALTTLTTVGFGDLRPYSNIERMAGVLLLLCGVMIFSYIIGNFLDASDALEEVAADNEHADDLSRFFGILQKFNYNRILKKEFTTRIEEYFEYFWSNDKLYSVATDEDLRYYDELPPDHKVDIFKNFLFRPFVQTFKKLFEIPKHKHVKHSYYKWFDESYSEFMIQVMRYLEPRFYKKDELIYEEL